MYALHVIGVSPPNDVVQPAGRAHLPGQVEKVTQGQVIGSTHNVPTSFDVSQSRYIDRNVGGATGVSKPLGFTIGMGPWRAPRMSGMTVIPPRTNIATNQGPVGVSNWQGRLRSGVDSLFAQSPTLEQIYASMTGGM